MSSAGSGLRPARGARSLHSRRWLVLVVHCLAESCLAGPHRPSENRLVRGTSSACELIRRCRSPQPATFTTSRKIRRRDQGELVQMLHV